MVAVSLCGLATNAACRKLAGMISPTDPVKARRPADLNSLTIADIFTNPDKGMKMVSYMLDVYDDELPFISEAYVTIRVNLMELDMREGHRPIDQVPPLARPLVESLCKRSGRVSRKFYPPSLDPAKLYPINDLVGKQAEVYVTQTMRTLKAATRRPDGLGDDTALQGLETILKQIYLGELLQQRLRGLVPDGLVCLQSLAQISRPWHEAYRSVCSPKGLAV